MDDRARVHASRMMVRTRAVNEDGPASSSSSSSFDGFATRDSGDEPRSGASSPPQSAASLARARLGTKKKLTAKEAIQLALDDLDSNGLWAVISSGIVFGTFLLETYNVSSLGGWDILYREDIPWYTGIISMQSLIDIEDAYNLLFLFELGLRAYAADFSLKFWTKPVTIVDVASTVPPLLAIFEVLDRSAPFYRFLRLLRVLRLLRLLDRSPDSVLFGLVKSDSMGVQLVGIGAEFVCIFVIAWAPIR